MRRPMRPPIITDLCQLDRLLQAQALDAQAARRHDAQCLAGIGRVVGLLQAGIDTNWSQRRTGRCIPLAAPPVERREPDTEITSDLLN